MLHNTGVLIKLKKKKLISPGIVFPFLKNEIFDFRNSKISVLLFFYAFFKKCMKLTIESEGWV
ncbi:hypothetical protein CSTERLE_10630 [Thermoclostridium stercorarium subsp. leptospartum DSM 9219]|uniref:Uncharacterized protein n=1 Tax=Thermoclostridium stercorarium subsp. leptospartum DSM 9219 TaxID=1346611 RepID=A0A1B1YMJ5_THEST|nr:hypothetical protein CSTERLE_10630 [Thermoclostridium stercorarium subsp. leptospartum DSM 9219]